MSTPTHDATGTNVEPAQDTRTADENVDISKAERVLSADEVEFAKAHQNYEAVDKELAQYVSDARIEISPEKNAELRKKIDKRILSVMVATYFLQAYVY